MKYSTGTFIFIAGVLGGYFINILFEPLTTTGIIIVNQELIGDDNRVIPKDTVLVYVDDAAEGYMEANMAIAIEGDALKHVTKAYVKQPNVKERYFFYDAK